MEAISLRDTYISPCKHRPAMPETSGPPCNLRSSAGGPSCQLRLPQQRAPVYGAQPRPTLPEGGLRGLRFPPRHLGMQRVMLGLVRYTRTQDSTTFMCCDRLCALRTQCFDACSPLQEPGGGGLPGRASGSTRPRGRLSGSRICYPARSAAQQGLQMLRRSAPQRAPWLLSSSSDPRPLVAAPLWLALLRALCLHMHTHSTNQHIVPYLNRFLSNP